MTGPQKKIRRRFHCFKWFIRSWWVPEKESP